MLSLLRLLVLALAVVSTTAGVAAELDDPLAVKIHKRATATGTTIVPPRTPFGCKRIWRCDDQVCEWRRGCWGVYGYVESPYYAVPLAKRQWTQQGLPR